MARVRRWQYFRVDFPNLSSGATNSTISDLSEPADSTVTRILISAHLEYQPAAELIARNEFFMGVAVTDTTQGVDPVGPSAFRDAWMWHDRFNLTTRQSPTTAGQPGVSWANFDVDVRGQRRINPGTGLLPRLYVRIDPFAAGGVKSARFQVRTLTLLAP